MAPEVKMANPSRITNFLSSLVPAPIKRGFNTGVDVMTAAAQAAKEKGVGQGYSVSQKSKTTNSKSLTTKTTRAKCSFSRAR